MPEVRPIDAEMAKSRIGELCLNNIDLISTTAFDRIMGVIDCCETISPEVRHGRWIELPKALNPEETPCKCSVCGHILSFYGYYPKSKFCPNCGARMEDNYAE